MDEPVDNLEPEPQVPAEEDPLAPKKKPRSRNGFIARLPKKIRDRLNVMLLDGHLYKEIVATLALHEKGIDESHVSTWKTHGGHDQWIKERQYLVDWNEKWEFAQDVVEQGHGLNIHQSTNQLIASQISQVMQDCGPKALQDAVGGGSRNVIQLVQAFAQLTKSEVDCERLKSGHGTASGGEAKDPMRAETHESIEKKENLL